jgi:cytosine/adenosine deaminase-related metal-dependent hydrolase
MWETMRSAVYMARVRETMGEPKSPSYYDILELATIKGAEVMGVEDKVGSLEVGKKADIQLIDLKCPHIYPTADVTSSLVLYGATVNVETVMVDGKILKRDGRMVGLDVGGILDEAQRITMKIWEGLYKDRPELKNLN